MDIRDVNRAVKSGTQVPAEVFQEIFRQGPTYLDSLKLAKLWQKMPSTSPQQDLKLAVTGTGTLDYLANLVRDGLAFHGHNADLFVSAYSEYVADLMSPDSALWNHAPDVLLFVNDSTRVWSLASWADDADAVAGAVRGDIEFLMSLLQPVQQRGCQVLVLNALVDVNAAPGHLRRSRPGSSWNLVQAWNDALVEHAGTGIKVIDICFEALKNGRTDAFNRKQWYESKLPYSLDFHATVAASTVDTVVSRSQADKKVIVLDCDNTIWGGVVGDDGIEGIEIGTVSARAQAFADLQRSLLRLKDAGFLLAVCSKNEEDTVLHAFREHQEMVLRETDIVAFRVNWESKADNIASIAEELNLGLDSFVFLDDNPAELEIVSQFAPDVTCVLASEDPTQTIHTVENSAVFFRSVITAEDAEKTEQYRSEQKRKSLAQSITNYDDYLNSLDMSAEISAIDEQSATRSSQLINKSNQFNLTTIRRTEAEVLQVVADPNWRTLTVRLADKFGDHGLISVVLAELQSDALLVETLVMSCRVLKRGVERLIVRELVELARREGKQRLIGLYRPTKKNAMVSGLFEELQFTQIDTNDQQTTYELSVETYVSPDIFIELTS